MYVLAVHSDVVVEIHFELAIDFQSITRVGVVESVVILMDEAFAYGEVLCELDELADGRGKSIV